MRRLDRDHVEYLEPDLFLAVRLECERGSGRSLKCNRSCLSGTSNATPWRILTRYRTDKTMLAIPG